MTRNGSCLLSLALLAVAVAAACHYANPHGSQALPPTTRLITEPPGAKVYLTRLNVELETPCDLPESVDEDDRITISMPGYSTFEGHLGDLRQVALGTYRLALVK